MDTGGIPVVDCPGRRFLMLDYSPRVPTTGGTPVVDCLGCHFMVLDYGTGSPAGCQLLTTLVVTSWCWIMAPDSRLAVGCQLLSALAVASWCWTTDQDRRRDASRDCFGRHFSVLDYTHVPAPCGLLDQELVITFSAADKVGTGPGFPAFADVWTASPAISRIPTSRGCYSLDFPPLADVR